MDLIFRDPICYYLSAMRKSFVFLFVIAMGWCQQVWGQTRYSTLIIDKGKVFDYGESDILVTDTLIMRDSSTLIVNKLKKENYLHAKVLIVGKGCSIDGSGVTGTDGRAGQAGVSPFGPCKSGTDGTSGTHGLDGGNGTHIFLYLQQVSINDVLKIYAMGGGGGNGGRGGDGGNGSPGTVHCNGGDGGDGGNGGRGGNGGSGGMITIDCKNCPVTYDWIGKKIAIINYGGPGGNGGTRGAGGYFGSGPRGRNGKYGVMGSDGARGESGNRGEVNFVIEQ
jgi:hypothetical protein